MSLMDIGILNPFLLLFYSLMEAIRLHPSLATQMATQVSLAMYNLHSHLPNPISNIDDLCLFFWFIFSDIPFLLYIFYMSKILHHDLKSRNCLVMEDWTIKVAGNRV